MLKYAFPVIVAQLTLLLTSCSASPHKKGTPAEPIQKPTLQVLKQDTEPEPSSDTSSDTSRDPTSSALPASELRQIEISATAPWDENSRLWMKKYEESFDGAFSQFAIDGASDDDTRKLIAAVRVASANLLACVILQYQYRDWLGSKVNRETIQSMIAHAKQLITMNLSKDAETFSLQFRYTLFNSYLRALEMRAIWLMLAGQLEYIRSEEKQRCVNEVSSQRNWLFQRSRATLDSLNSESTNNNQQREMSERFSSLLADLMELDTHLTLIAPEDACVRVYESANLVNQLNHVFLDVFSQSCFPTVAQNKTPEFITFTQCPVSEREAVAPEIKIKGVQESELALNRLTLWGDQILVHSADGLFQVNLVKKNLRSFSIPGCQRSITVQETADSRYLLCETDRRLVLFSTPKDDNIWQRVPVSLFANSDKQMWLAVNDSNLAFVTSNTIYYTDNSGEWRSTLFNSSFPTGVFTHSLSAALVANGQLFIGYKSGEQGGSFESYGLRPYDIDGKKHHRSVLDLSAVGRIKQDSNSTIWALSAFKQNNVSHTALWRVADNKIEALFHQKKINGMMEHENDAIHQHPLAKYCLPTHALDIAFDVKDDIVYLYIRDFGILQLSGGKVSKLIDFNIDEITRDTVAWVTDLMVTPEGHILLSTKNFGVFAFFKSAKGYIFKQLKPEAT